MKSALLKAFLCGLVLCAKLGPASAAPGFPGTLDSLYAHLTQTLFETYVLTGTKTIVLLPVETRGAYDTVISINGNAVLISRLNQRIESSADVLLRDVVIVEGSLLDYKDAAPVFLQIAISNVRVEGDTYALEVRLNEVSPAGAPTLVETLAIGGSDENILFYVTEPFVPPLWLWLLPLVLLIALIRFSRKFLYKIPFIAAIRRVLRKRSYTIPLLNGLNRAENVPFWRMTVASVLMILLFTTVLLIVKRNAIEGHSYFEGAEVYFFIDRNSGLFFNAGESNFKNLTKEIMREACNEISYQILHPDTPELEKLADYLTRAINVVLETVGLGRFKLRTFVDLKQSDYTYAIYTFSAENIEQLAAGNLAELVVDYDSVITPVLELTPETRHSSLVLPLSTLYDKLVESKLETRRKKKFIILFTDATETLPQHVRSFQENVNRLITRKDQYLRVFSVFFPNIPRVSSGTQIYPYEEGKLLLLSKISEFIVYMNGIDEYTPERLREVDRLFYEHLKGFVEQDSLTAANYEQKLAQYEALLARVARQTPLSIHDIAAQNFLKNFVEINVLRDADAPVTTDFFLYTYVTPDLYEVKNLGYANRDDWVDPGDYTEARGRLFGQPLDPHVVDRVVGDIVQTFVHQFIIIDKEIDKESLIFKIGFWITMMAIGFSLFYAWLLYRYKFNENYRMERKDWVINIFMIGLVLLLLILSLAYFRHDNRWTIYGNWVWAFGISLGFLFAYYYLPLFFLWLSQNRKFQPLGDVTFDFEEAKSIKWLDRVVFNILTVPFLAVALFLQILSPVYKQRDEASDDWFISAMDSVYRSGLDLSDYNKVIEYFLLLWVVVAVIYLLRTFIYSKKVAVVST